MALQRYLVEAARAEAEVQPDRRRRWAAALVNLGANHLARGELDEAAAAFEAAANVPELRAAAIGNLAIVRRDQRDWVQAEVRFREADQLYRADSSTGTS